MLESTVDWLLDKYSVESEKLLDLSQILLLVQTINAGRRIREALASKVKELGGKGLFSPRIGTPHTLVRPKGRTDRPVATLIQCLSVWCRVLTPKNIEDRPALFPKPAAFGDSASQLTLARSLEGLRRSLAEACLNCRQLLDAGRCADGEVRRWEALASLEDAYLQELEDAGLLDPWELQRAAAEEPSIPDGVEQIFILGVTDLSPLNQKALENLPEELVTSLVIFGPEGCSREAFDEWGRPLPEFWTASELDIDDAQIHLSTDETAQARKVAEFFEKQKDKEGKQGAALGVTDPNLSAKLRWAHERRGLAVYDPAGQPARRHELHAFLAGVSEMLGNPSFHGAENLLRMPIVQRIVVCNSVTELLRGLDLLRTRAIPSTLADAVAVVPWNLIPPGGRNPKGDDWARQLVSSAREAAERLKSFLDGVRRASSLRDSFKELFADLELASLGDPSGLDLVLDCLYVSVEELEHLNEKGVGIPLQQALQMVLDELAKFSIPERHDPDAVELQGWLELLWEPAPHLLVTGFQENAVPKSVTGDLFLPNSLRRDIGLPGNQDRLARDVWQAACLLESRRNGGRMDFLLSRTSDVGDPILPSRLLFLCGETELVPRVQKLFGKLAAEELAVPWSTPWKLTPSTDRPKERMSVTDFRAYLDSPFLFFLNRVLRMDEVDIHKADLDPMEFGTFLHTVLEGVAPGGPMADCAEEERIRDFLHHQLKEQLALRYGTLHSAPLLAQAASARERLSLAARHQAETAGDGWVVHKVEHRIEMPLGGVKVTGYIDRVDHHPETGCWRVVDYKTGSSADSPDKEHLGETSRSILRQQMPGYARFINEEGKEFAWKDLQLPLYVLAWKLEHPGDDIQAAYFKLPPTSDGAGIHNLTLNPDLLDSARECAEGIITEVLRDRSFWPLRRKLSQYEESHRRLMFHDPELTMEPPVVTGQEEQDEQ